MLKKIIIIILVFLLPVGLTTYAQKESVPDVINIQWAIEKMSNHEKYVLMGMNNKISLYYAENTLNDYLKITDPIYNARTPVIRVNNMVIMEYGINEQEQKIRDIEDSIRKSMESDIISVRDSLYTLYSSKLNISYYEKSVYFADINLKNTTRYFENNSGSETAVINAKYSLESAMVTLNEAKTTYQNNQMSFNRLIGIDLTTTYKNFNLDEELLIKDTTSIKNLADKKYESLIKEKEYQIEKENFRKKELESLIYFYPNNEDIPNEIEKINENIIKINNEIEKMEFYQRRTYNEKAQSMINIFDSIQDIQENITDLNNDYNKLYNQYRAGDVGYVSVEQKALDIEKAKNNLKLAIFNFNNRYMAYLIEMEV